MCLECSFYIAYEESEIVCEGLAKGLQINGEQALSKFLSINVSGSALGTCIVCPPHSFPLINGSDVCQLLRGL